MKKFNKFGVREFELHAENVIIYSGNYTNNKHNDLALIQIYEIIEQIIENQFFTINGIYLPQEGIFNKIHELVSFLDGISMKTEKNSFI